MPVPAILGLPWLATAIGSLFSGLFVFFAQYLTKRVAVIAAVIALVLASTLGMIALIESLLTGITYIAPDFQYVGLILPSNFSSCLGACITARLAYWAYSWNTRIIQYKLNL